MAMAAIPAVAAIAVLGSAVAAGSDAASSDVKISPSSGSPRTHFKVTFTTPERTGVIGALVRHDVVSAHAGRRPKGCVADVEATAPPAEAHARVSATLGPRAEGWCTGTFAGRIEELEAPHCPKGQVCPAFVVLIRTLGRFTFKVVPKLR
jgi:hypothetical protein